MRRLRSAGFAAVVVLAATASAAYADQTIYALPPTQYFGGDISISQGDKVTFTNLDTVTHDVTAKTAGPDGKPLFGSAYAGPVGSQPVTGTEYLTTGSYEYFCSIHPYMTGTITVTSTGTPAPRPGGGGTGTGTGSGSGSGAGSPTGSTAANSAPNQPGASVHLKILDAKVAAVRKRGALRVSVSSDQPATLGLSARAGKTVVASGSATFATAGARTVSLKLTAAGAKLVKRSRSLALSLSASGAGSTASAATTATLR